MPRSERRSDAPEVRTLALTRADVNIEDGGGPTFRGYASKFNARAAIGNPQNWGWYEEIASGAFTKTLQESDVRMLVDHDSRMLVARMSAGDLRLSEDTTGLLTDADLDQEVSYVRDLTRNLEKRRATGMSFGFHVIRDEWSNIDVERGAGPVDRAELRVIREVKLLEVSVVTFPAYDQTEAGLRSMTAEVRAARDHASTETPVEPAPSDDTRDLDEDEPAAATRNRVRVLMRAKSLAARYGLEL